MLINNVCVCSWWIWCISQIVLFMLFRRGPRGAISSPQTASVWSWEPHLRLHLQSRSCCLCQADAAAAFTCDGEGEKKISGFQPQTALFYPLCRAPFVILLSGPIPRICQPIPDSRNPQTHTHRPMDRHTFGTLNLFWVLIFRFQIARLNGQDQKNQKQKQKHSQNRNRNQNQELAKRTKEASADLSRCWSVDCHIYRSCICRPHENIPIDCKVLAIQ